MVAAERYVFERIPYEVPIGLAFAHLKGTIEHLNRKITEYCPLDELVHARMMVHKAIYEYTASVADTDEMDGIVKIYKELGQGQLKEADFLFSLVSERLLRALGTV